MLRAHTSSANRPHPLAELWRSQELVRTLVARNLKVKYKRSALGFLWTLINPALMVAILTGVFTYIARLPVPNYWAFLLSGYFVWNFVMQTVGSGASVLAEHANLSRSVALPSEVLLVSAALTRLAEFALEMTLVVVALVLFHFHGVPASLLLLPLLVVLQLLLALGIALPVAALSVFFHDVQHALPLVLTMLFYVTPVFYPARLVPEKFLLIYHLNPFAGLLTLYQTVLYEGAFPAPLDLARTAGLALILCVLGYAAFNRSKAVFAEIL